MSDNIEIIPSSSRQQACISHCSTFLHSRLKRSGTYDNYDLAESRSKAVKIINKAGALDSPSKNILVSGYVQSGKTLSMEHTIAVAKDSGYGVVILLTGTTINLNSQTKKRFTKDFKPELFGDTFFKMYDAANVTKHDLRSSISKWKDDKDKPIPVIFTLKQYQRIQNIAELLGGIGGIETVPALIITDESDHYEVPRRGATSPNTIHNSINILRSVFNKLSYIMYTATPAANIAIRSKSIMEADDAVVLSSGKNYTGGSTFFPQEELDDLNDFCEIIDPFSLQDDMRYPPKSLKKALNYFFVCLASHAIRCKEGFYDADSVTDQLDLHRTMMIHVHAQCAPMDHYIRFVLDLIEGYKDLRNDESYRIKFHEAYKELGKKLGHYSGKEIEDFDSIIESIKDILDNENYNIGKFASGGNPDYIITNDRAEEWWEDKPGHIIVGGFKLDRGFTVKKITVTYFSRPSSSNQSTDLQQARWYGYHRDYIGYIKLYMSQERHNFYSDYIQVENYLRCVLTAVENGTKDIQEAINLPVLEGFTSAGRGRDFKAYTSINVTDDQWQYVNWPITCQDTGNRNMSAIDAFLATYRDEFKPYDTDYSKKPDTDHRICEIPFKDLIKVIIDKYSFALPASMKYFKAILVDGYETFLANNKDYEKCAVVVMGNLKEKERSKTTSGCIGKFHQGANRLTGFVGDALIYDPSKISIQIYKFNVEGVVSYYLAYHLPNNENISIEGYE